MYAKFFLCCAFLTATAFAQGGVSTLNGLGNRSVNNQILNRPTVSPYLQLLQNNGAAAVGAGATASIYQTQVRPAVEARRQAAVQQGQINQIRNDLNRARQQFSRPTGQNSTGHPTRFMSYSHYYPGFGR